MNKLLTVSRDGKESIVFIDHINDLQVIHKVNGIKTERWYSVYTFQQESFIDAAYRIIANRYGRNFEPLTECNYE